MPCQLKFDEEITLMNWGNAIFRKIHTSPEPHDSHITHLDLDLHLERDFKKTKLLSCPKTNPSSPAHSSPSTILSPRTSWKIQTISSTTSLQRPKPGCRLLQTAMSRISSKEISYNLNGRGTIAWIVHFSRVSLSRRSCSRYPRVKRNRCAG